MTRSPATSPFNVRSRNGHHAVRTLVIGVVNNMSAAAVQATDDQFDGLLREALPAGWALNIRCFYPTNQSNAEQQLWAATLHGLIVTGAEPQADHISSEPCYPLLSRIFDWADARELPTIWSCLAAHAAVYHLDGIERQQRGTKLFGAFECDKVQLHPLLDGTPAAWTLPHSRLNDLAESDLTDCGYQVLTRSIDVGVDTFVKQMGASHVFLNGHPEYRHATLQSEYRRDVRRFLAGEQAHYPPMPAGYFSAEVARKMAAFRKMVSNRRMPELMAHFPARCLPDCPTRIPWRDTAIGLFRNWLLGVARHKADREAQFDETNEFGPTEISRNGLDYMQDRSRTISPPGRHNGHRRPADGLQ